MSQAFQHKCRWEEGGKGSSMVHVTLRDRELQLSSIDTAVAPRPAQETANTAAPAEAAAVVSAAAWDEVYVHLRVDGLT